MASIIHHPSSIIHHLLSAIHRLASLPSHSIYLLPFFVLTHDITSKHDTADCFIRFSLMIISFLKF